MSDAVIVSALRTPIGTARKGTLRDTSAFELAQHVVTEAARDLDPAQVDDVILGEGLYGGGVIARHAAITAGLSHVPGLANNRHCAAGQAAVQSAAASVRAGMDELIIAGGVNAASTSPRSRIQVDGEWVDWFPPTHPDRPDAPNMDMSITVGWNAAVKAGVSREEMDAWALRSHRNAIAAIDEGRFKEEIVPIETPHGLFSVDEHPRRDTTMEKLAALKPLHPEIEGFSITAGNACGANDGAAALVIASDRLGMPALATIRSGHRSASIRRSPAWRRWMRYRKPLSEPDFRRRTSIFSRSTKPSPRCVWPPSNSSSSTPTGSTSVAVAARWVTPSRRPEPGCWSPWCTNCVVAAVASASRRCARAVVWVRRP